MAFTEEAAVFAVAVDVISRWPASRVTIAGWQVGRQPWCSLFKVRKSKTEYVTFLLVVVQRHDANRKARNIDISSPMA